MMIRDPVETLNRVTAEVTTWWKKENLAWGNPSCFFFAGGGKEMWGPWGGGVPIQQPYGIRVVHLLVFI